MADDFEASAKLFAAMNLATSEATSQAFNPAAQKQPGAGEGVSALPAGGVHPDPRQQHAYAGKPHYDPSGYLNDPPASGMHGGYGMAGGHGHSSGSSAPRAPSSMVSGVSGASTLSSASRYGMPGMMGAHGHSKLRAAPYGMGGMAPGMLPPPGYAYGPDGFPYPPPSYMPMPGMPAGAFHPGGPYMPMGMAVPMPMPLYPGAAPGEYVYADVPPEYRLAAGERGSAAAASAAAAAAAAGYYPSPHGMAMPVPMPGACAAVAPGGKMPPGAYPPGFEYAHMAGGPIAFAPYHPGMVQQAAMAAPPQLAAQPAPQPVPTATAGSSPATGSGTVTPQPSPSIRSSSAGGPPGLTGGPADGFDAQAAHAHAMQMAHPAHMRVAIPGAPAGPPGLAGTMPYGYGYVLSPTSSGGMPGMMMPASPSPVHAPSEHSSAQSSVAYGPYGVAASTASPARPASTASPARPAAGGADDRDKPGFAGVPWPGTATLPNTPQAEIPINPGLIESGMDSRTTVMIRNVPNKYTPDLMLAELDASGFKGRYDFFYLPIDFKNRCNMGFAFLNMLHSTDVLSLYRKWQNQKWPHFASRKVCELAYARIQGRASLVARFSKSEIMAKAPPQCQPILFYTSGPNAGMREPWESAFAAAKATGVLGMASPPPYGAQTMPMPSHVGSPIGYTGPVSAMPPGAIVHVNTPNPHLEAAIASYEASLHAYGGSMEAVHSQWIHPHLAAQAGAAMAAGGAGGGQGASPALRASSSPAASMPMSAGQAASVAGPASGSPLPVPHGGVDGGASQGYAAAGAAMEAQAPASVDQAGASHVQPSE